MLMDAHNYLPHTRIVYRKNHLWFSELLGVTIVSTLLLAFVILGIIVFVNEFRIDKNSAAISRQQVERVVLQHTLWETGEKQVIASALKSFTRGKVDDRMIRILTDQVYANSKTFGYDPLLLLAVIREESMFQAAALGQFRNGTLSGALGLMQLKFETAKEVAGELGIELNNGEDLFLPEINIPLGVAYLTKMISKFKSFKLGMLAYNQGPGVIQSSLRNKLPLSIGYYKRVLKQYYSLKKCSLYYEKIEIQ